MIEKYNFPNQILIISDFSSILFMIRRSESHGERCNCQIDRCDREESAANKLSLVVSVSDGRPLYQNRHGFSRSGLSLAYTTIAGKSDHWSQPACCRVNGQPIPERMYPRPRQGYRRSRIKLRSLAIFDLIPILNASPR